MVGYELSEARVQVGELGLCVDVKCLSGEEDDQERRAHGDHCEGTDVRRASKRTFYSFSLERIYFPSKERCCPPSSFFFRRIGKIH